jgi:Heparinase II/III-like protein/Heparinase II/III N-terminus
MNVRRLGEMSPGEIVGRARQVVARHVDGLASSRRAHRPRRRPIAVDPARFREHLTTSFFPGPGDSQAVTRARERCPGIQGEILGAAQNLLEARFDLLGYRGLFFGVPIDWHLDPIAGRRAPLVHWNRLNPLDVAQVGDSKVIWELNRHQWLVGLALAYTVSGDERYAENAVSQIVRWKAENPVGLGINWASSLEIALRLIAWSWTLALLRESRHLSAEVLGEIVESVEAHARHIERFLSYYFSPNTHLTGEALGLLYAGTAFGDLPSALRWKTLGHSILVEQLQRQVLEDGVYFEQSTCYQRYTVEIALHLMVLSARHRLEVPPTLRQRVERMLEVLLHWRRPDGTLPAIGDSDGGVLLPLSRRPPHDFRGVFSVAAVLLDRGDFAWAAGGITAELIWTLGSEGVKRFDALPSDPPSGPPSRVLPDGGYVVMRSHWGLDAHHLIYDVGPLGCPISGGHGHADLLSIQVAAFGEPVLVDAGTYTYADPAWRSALRETGAHSAVLVDGQSQARPTGPFKWGERPAATLCRWAPGEQIEVAEGEHEAYLRLSDPVRVRRRVLFVRRAYWIVVDDVEGAADHGIELRFQFAPLSVSLGPDLWVRAQGAHGRGLLLRTLADLPLATDVVEGDLQRRLGWVSSDYGMCRPAPMTRHYARLRLPHRFVTLLLPVEDVEAKPPEVTLVRGGSRPIAIRREDTGEHIVFEED